MSSNVCVQKYGYAHAILTLDDNEELARTSGERIDTVKVSFPIEFTLARAVNYTSKLHV